MSWPRLEDFPCGHGKSHEPQSQQCRCFQRDNKRQHDNERDYQEFPRGTESWYDFDDAEDSSSTIQEYCHCQEDEKPLPHSEVFGRRYLSVSGLHAEGEPYDIVTGGMDLDDVPGYSILEQQDELRESDWHRSFLLSEPRSHCGMNAALILPPTCPCADKGIVFMKSDSLQSMHDSYPPLSVTGLICATKVVLEQESRKGLFINRQDRSITWDTVAGPVKATGQMTVTPDGLHCQKVIVENVPSFVLELDYQIDCPPLGSVTVDIAFGGVFCAFVDAASVGLNVDRDDARKMAEIGEQIKRSINACYKCSHPTIPCIEQVSNLVFTEPVVMGKRHTTCVMAIVISPGRLDRSPSGTATSARLAILHKRRELEAGWLGSFSVIGSRLLARIAGHTKVGEHDAVLTVVAGRAWTISMKQLGFEENDRFLRGFRLEDLCGPSNAHESASELVGIGLQLNGEVLKPEQYSRDRYGLPCCR